MIGNQSFQTFFNRRAVNFLAVGKGCGVIDFDFYCEFVDLLETFCKPWLKLHMLIEFEKRFANSVAQSAPTAITFVRIGSSVFHSNAISDRAISKSFFAR